MDYKQEDYLNTMKTFLVHMLTKKVLKYLKISLCFPLESVKILFRLFNLEGGQ